MIITHLLKPLKRRHPRRYGYTLIELLIVMGIIMLMVTLVLLSVTAMLRSSRMSRAVSLMVSAADEARTTAITIRRSTRVDRTQLDPIGQYNRLTVAGPYFNENFESYNITNPAPPPPLQQLNPGTNNWLNTTGAWPLSDSITPPPCLQNDGSQCMRLTTPNSYWNVGSKVDKARDDDFETLVQARVKILPYTTPPSARAANRTLSVLACIKDAGNAISDAYRMNLMISPSATSPGRNTTSTITLDSVGGAALTNGPTSLTLDANSLSPSATTDLIEGVWYRVILSVKLITDQNQKTTAVIAGKVFADGQLEPLTWSVGPVTDSGTPLLAGPGGISVNGCDGLVDDVLFDDRPIRVIPAGLRLDCLAPPSSANRTPPGVPGTVCTAPPAPTPPLVAPYPDYDFPIVFHPDGTAAQTYVVRITDLTSGDTRYVTIDQNTGRSRACHSLAEALQK